MSIELGSFLCGLSLGIAIATLIVMARDYTIDKLKREEEAMIDDILAELTKLKKEMDIE